MNNSFNDRRKYVRIYRNFFLSYYLMTAPDHKIEISQVNNISRGGLNFIATIAFEQNTEIGIDLKTPFLTDTVVLRGIVLESKAKIEGMLYNVRLQFTNISPQAQEALLKIEQYALKENA